MKNRHAERLTRDVFLTLSSGSNLFYDPFLEFPCVALALVHFSTLLSLCYYYFFFFFPYFYYNYFVICYFISRASTIYRIEKFEALEIAKSKSRAMKRQTFLFFFFLTQKLQPAFTANFVDFFFFFSLTSIFQYFESDCCALLLCYCRCECVKYTICLSNCNDLALSGL